jgi:exonuclease SbcD
MEKIRFIHTADLHLDTPFKGLTSWNNELAERLKDATFKAFRNIIDLCLQEKVDFLVIAGDIFESENKSLAAQLRFVKELERLSTNGIPTYFVCGNHDPLNSWIGSLKLPENVYRFGSSKVECVTYKRDNIKIADIYGISFRNKVVEQNLALKFNLTKNPAPLSIAVLHGTVGIPGPHENYAPFRKEDVLNKNFSYWALGHIHKRQIIHDSDPAVVYPGNPQARDFGETGSKGCYLAELSSGNKPHLKFLPANSIRFEAVEVDLTGEDNINKIEEKIREANSNIVKFDENDNYILRITLKGRTPLHNDLNKPGEIEQLIQLFNEGQLTHDHFTWIDRIELKTWPDMDTGQAKKGKDFIADILNTFDRYENEPGMLKQLLLDAEEEFSSLTVKKELDELTETEAREVLEKAKWMLIDQLMTTKRT